MNYTKIYNTLISKRQLKILTENYEKHHIIPKCVGGSNDSNNIVKLTRREHQLVHLLLPYIYPDSIGLKVSANLFSKRRIKYGSWNKNVPMSDTQKSKLSKSKTGVKLTEAHRNAIGKTSPFKKKVKVFEAICIRPNKRNQTSLYEKGKFIVEYNSIREASRNLMIKGQRIHQVLNGSRAHARKYIFEYGK